MASDMKNRTLTAALSPEDISRVIEMAWEDRTAFEAIELQFGLNESAVVALMRTQMKLGSFKMWRKRMKGRVTKHAAVSVRFFISEAILHALTAGTGRLHLA